MKKFLTVLVMSIAITCMPAFAHHAADGIVDEETYEMIDDLVSDTPHADMTLEDLGSGMTEITIITDTLTALMNLIEDGLLEIISDINGDTSITIEFNEDGTITTTITVQGYNYDSTENRNTDD